MYYYRVHSVEKIYDGDTVKLWVDLGFNIIQLMTFRLAYINAPEVRGDERPEGLVSRDWLREKMFTAEKEGTDIFIKTFKDTKGKYGRYIAEIIIDGISLNKQMVTEGLAIYKGY